MSDAGIRSWEAAEERQRGWLAPLVLVLLALVAGVALAVYAVGHSERLMRLLHLQPQGSAVTAATTPAATPLRPAPAASAERLAAIERRLAALDQRTAGVSGDADRAEALLTAFAARRALDRGVQLGYVEGLLRFRFGGVAPQSVAAVIAAAQRPITLEQLRTGFAAIRSRLVSQEPGESWWQGVRRELGSLVIVRRADTPSTIPADRLDRTERLLEDGQVDRAMAEVSRLPGRAAAAAWLADARRYVQARNALDQIETAALLRPDTPLPGN